MVIGEQIRLFDSFREKFKTYVQPLKVLISESKFSLGVTGIKEETAVKIEHYLIDSTSEFYIGSKYRHLLDFKTADIPNERFGRLTNWNNHYYSYLYAAIFLKQIDAQWKRAGYDIEPRVEILATLFNLGFWVSKPKPDPRCGGSNIKIGEKWYTFGSLSYEFYWSGELASEFPYLDIRFGE
jgi:hypothetical protein